MAKQSAGGHQVVRRARAGQKVAVIENITIWKENTWEAYADHGDDTHIVTGKEKYVADRINLNDYYLWQGKATDTNNYYNVYALIYKIEITKDNQQKLFIRTKYYNISQKGDPGKSGTNYQPNLLTGANKQLSATTYEIGHYTWEAGKPANGTQLTLTVCYALDKDDTTGGIKVFQDAGSQLVATLTSTTEEIKRVTWTYNAASGLNDAQYLMFSFYHGSNLGKDVEHDSKTYIKWAVVTKGTDEMASWVPAASEMIGEDALQYTIEVDNETPNITNGAVKVKFTAYTQFGKQQRQQATLEAGKLWWDGQTSNITNPLEVSVSSELTVNLRTKDGIVATKHVTPVKDGVQGIQGIQGCIVRVSEWVIGVEYHNDEALTTGTRYLDIAVVTMGANTFKAYKCRVTHTATADNAPVAGTTTTQWESFNNLAPIYTPFIMSQHAILRLTQSNQILVTDEQNNAVAGLQANTVNPILWVQDPHSLSAVEIGLNTSDGVVALNIFGANHKKGISLQMDDAGMPHLIFYDTNERGIYDLGYTGLKQLITKSQDATWVTLYLYDVSNYLSSKTYLLYNATQQKSAGTAGFQYKSSYNSITNTYGSDAAYNDKIYQGNDGGLVENAASHYISDTKNYYKDGMYIFAGGWEAWMKLKDETTIYRNVVSSISSGTLRNLGYIYTNGKKLTDALGVDIQNEYQYVYSALISKE